MRDPAASLDPLQLGAWVDEHATSRDFREPFGGGLDLDLRGDVLFVRGVVDEDSHEQVYDVLSNELHVGTLVFTMVPGSADDDTNLALGRMLRRAGIATICRPGERSLRAAPTCSSPASDASSSAAPASGSIAGAPMTCATHPRSACRGTIRNTRGTWTTTATWEFRRRSTGSRLKPRPRTGCTG